MLHEGSVAQDEQQWLSRRRQRVCSTFQSSTKALSLAGEVKISLSEL